MKKTIIKSMAVAMFAATALTSCSDFLDAENKVTGGQTADQFFQSNPSSLLISAYANLKSVVNQVEIFDEGTDLYINTRGGAPSEFGNYALNTNNKDVENLYVKLMGTINYSNGVLKYAGATSLDAYEARFLRNYAYYMLTQHFGSVPYVTSYIESAAREYPRTPLEECYTKMIEDLNGLLSSSLPEMSAHNGHVSKQAVKALLAKVELAAGWDLDVTVTDETTGAYTVNKKDHFVNAKKWANEALAGVEMYGTLSEKWNPANEASNKEEIFSIVFQSQGLPGAAGSDDNTLCWTYGGYPTGTDKSGLKYCNSKFQQSAKSMNLFEKGDTRYEGTFMTTFYDGASLADGYMAYYNGADPNKHKINARWFPSYMSVDECEAELKAHIDQFIGLNSANTFKAARLDPSGITVWSVNAQGVLSKTTETMSSFNNKTNNGTCVKKHDDPSSMYNDAAYRNIVLLHARQMKLIIAEASLLADDNGFWSAINDIRMRAGLPEISSMAQYDPLYSRSFALTEIDLLLDERARECYAEQTRWEDLKRTKQLIRYNVAFNEYVTSADKMKGVDGNFKWLRPIPDNEISYNSAMTFIDQNPGYVVEEGDKDESEVKAE